VCVCVRVHACVTPKKINQYC